MKSRIFVFIIAPFILLMVVFYVYTIYDMENSYAVLEDYYDRKHSFNEDGMHPGVKWFILSQGCRILMLILVFYFSLIELMQMIYDGFRAYFTNIQNIMEFSLYTLILVAEILAAITRWGDINKSDGLHVVRVIRTLYSVATLLMWVKFLYIFRTQRSTGYYIRMLIEVHYDIINFMFIFISIIICFAQAFYIFMLNS